MKGFCDLLLLTYLYRLSRSGTQQASPFHWFTFCFPLSLHILWLYCSRVGTFLEKWREKGFTTLQSSTSINCIFQKPEIWDWPQTRKSKEEREFGDLQSTLFVCTFILWTDYYGFCCINYERSPQLAVFHNTQIGKWVSRKLHSSSTCNGCMKKGRITGLSRGFWVWPFEQQNKPHN